MRSKVLIFVLVGVLALAVCAAPPTPTPAPAVAPPATKPLPVIAAQYVDVHMHLDGLYRVGGTVVKDYETAAKNLIAQMDQYSVAKALILPPPQILGQSGSSGPAAYQDLLEVVRANPNRLYLVAGGDTLNPLIHGTAPSAVTSALRAQFETKAMKIVRAGAKGFGEMAALHLSFESRHPYEETSPDHPLFLLLADIAAREGLPIDLHMEAVTRDIPLPKGFRSPPNASVLRENITALERLLSHNRQARIVWQHIGWDNTGHKTIDLLRRLLKAHPNLYLALRVEERQFTKGGDPMPNRIVDANWQVRPDWIQLISEFPDRFMIGGDEFIGISGRTPRRPQSFEETWRILSQFPSTLATQVGRDNAARIYNLSGSAANR
jgi:hypothetical protein